MTSEPAFIAALRAIATAPAARGLADDAAVLDIGTETLIATHDMMGEGVHWLPGQDPADVAWKLVAVNLSDLAAKGAEPRADRAWPGNPPSGSGTIRRASGRRPVDHRPCRRSDAGVRSAGSRDRRR